jgi:hypothetical protein
VDRFNAPFEIGDLRSDAVAAETGDLAAGLRERPPCRSSDGRGQPNAADSHSFLR